VCAWVCTIIPGIRLLIHVTLWHNAVWMWIMCSLSKVGLVGLLSYCVKLRVVYDGLTVVTLWWTVLVDADLSVTAHCATVHRLRVFWHSPVIAAFMLPSVGAIFHCDVELAFGAWTKRSVSSGSFRVTNIVWSIQTIHFWFASSASKVYKNNDGFSGKLKAKIVWHYSI